jgi:hypothetical protein
MGAFDVFAIREPDQLNCNLLKQLLVEDDLRRTGVAVEHLAGNTRARRTAG